MPKRKKHNHERDQEEGRWNEEGGAALDPRKMAEREKDELTEAEAEFEEAFGKKKKDKK